MERKNTDRNISPISVRICLNGYRLSFIRDSRHVNAYQYQKIPHSSKRLSLSLLNLSFFFSSFFPRTIQDSWKREAKRFFRNDRVYHENSILSLHIRAQFVEQSTFQGSASMEKRTPCAGNAREARFSRNRCVKFDFLDDEFAAEKI